MKILCTTCSAAKRDDPEPLPAVGRYLSLRVARVEQLSRRLGVPMRILSGKYGLLEPSQPIPWYDHALTPDEVEALLPHLVGQLLELEATELAFFARPRSTPGWEPYHLAIERACAAAGVELEVLDAETELVTPAGSGGLDEA